MATKKEPELKLSGITVDLAGCEKQELILRAITHPLRQRLLRLMDESKNKQVNVTAMYSKLKLEQSVASQHLAILRKAGLVNAQRQGREILYSVNYDAISALNETIRSTSGFLAQINKAKR